ncbi:cation:proton antiporter [Allofournierella sp.]|uniref:cation:proton antiporter n=1 Tax=Allofournierella sp. TaxID=1940256 RepID=UPI003AEFDBD0
MLLSLTLILFCGFALGGIMQKLKLPALLGMMITGIILGPFVLNLIDASILEISADLRQIALIVILIRAGLALDLKDLKKVGRPAVLMCFVPATIEMAAVTIFGPLLFGISYLEAAIMGAVLAAVSPAVVVPRMLNLIKNGYGVKKGIPQLIMAGASVDDVYVIVLFTSFTGMYQGQAFNTAGLLKVPVSIVLGLALGILCGLIIVGLFRKIHMRDTVKILILMGAAFLFVSLETAIKEAVPLSGLLAVMALGGTIYRQYGNLAKRLSVKYEKVWIGAELLLFVLVGAAVDIRSLASVGTAAAALIALALAFRMVGVALCLVKTKLNRKERLFTAISYLPKATVQAAIGGIPLALGIPAGNTILTVAVVAILITAPVGAFGADLTYKKLLEKNDGDDGRK